MGHESPIEPWLAPDNRAACGLRTDWLRRAETDENRWQRKPKALAECSSVPRSRNGRPKQSCSTRWAGSQEKIRPQEKCFFLDSFHRTNQALLPSCSSSTRYPGATDGSPHELMYLIEVRLSS